MPLPRGKTATQTLAKQLVKKPVSEKWQAEKDSDNIRIQIRIKKTLFRKIMIATKNNGLHSEQDTIRAGLHSLFGDIEIPKEA